MRGGGYRLQQRIVVAAGQRGVGASTLAALLGGAFAGEGRRVLLVDSAADRGLSGILRLPGGAAGPAAVGEGIALVAGEQPEEPAGCEVVVTDAGWEWERISLACSAGAERLLAVAAPDRAALAAAYALVKAVGIAFPEVTVEVVLNRHREGTRSGDDELRQALERFLGRRIRRPWLVPEDACLEAGTQGGMLLADAVGGSEVAAATLDMAVRMLDSESGPSLAPARHITRSVG